MAYLVVAAPLLLLTSLTAAAQEPIYVYASVGDNQWVSDWPPIDSPATVDALFDWLSDTHHAKRIYWRGEQSRRWLRSHQFRRENLQYHDWWTNWIRHLSYEVRTDELAVDAARRRGMQIYVFDSLFDHGSPGDVGGCGKFPYASEDRLRIEHPKWRPVDRWGERTCAGPIEFCYPKARRALIRQYVSGVVQHDYDGLCFYTYVENMALRYADEFGFNEPIVAEFRRRHGVDIRTEPFDREAWYRLRGEYLTQFIRELHATLAAAGKKLSVTIRPDQPNYPQRWFGNGVDMPGAGMVYMDWEGWVVEGIVDEVFVWLGPGTQALLDRILQLRQDRPVEIVTYSSSPQDDGWTPYRQQGVSICSVAAPGYGIDAWALETTTPESLASPQWRVRAKALVDAAAGKLEPTATQIAAMAHDPHVLVRREALRALAATDATEQAGVLEAALTDAESSVRIAAANALAKVNGPETPKRIFAALTQDTRFQMKEACLVALSAMKAQALPEVLRGLASDQIAVREVAVRALAGIGGDAIQEPLLSALHDPAEGVRYWAVNGMGNVRAEASGPALLGAIRDDSTAVQMRAVQMLGDVAGALPPEVCEGALTALEAMFREYGDTSARADRSWGWRAVGNAMLAFGPRGREVLDAMQLQRQDRWLAWVAYEVVHVPQGPHAVQLCGEEQALADHAAFAPPFPGTRR